MKRSVLQQDGGHKQDYTCKKIRGVQTGQALKFYVPTPEVSVKAVVRSTVSCLASVDLSFWSVSTKLVMAHRVDIISRAILKSS